MATVHPTAVIDPSAVLAEGVEVGPLAVIGADVEIGQGTVIGAQAQIQGPCRIGERNQIFGPCAIGYAPQDISYKGEPTRLEVGDDNVIREFVTMSRGTLKEEGLTTVGSRNLFMAYAHVGHDCRVGSDTIFANGATLAGHVEIGDHATIGAYSAVHQFCRVGPHAYIGGFTVATQNVLPYVKTVGKREASTYGINTIGLQRKGFETDRIAALKRAYRILVRSKIGLEEALERIESELGETEEVRVLLEFLKADIKRGFIR